MPHADKKNLGSSLRQRIAVAAKMTAKEQENISSAKNERYAKKSMSKREKGDARKRPVRSSSSDETAGTSSRSRKTTQKEGSSKAMGRAEARRSARQSQAALSQGGQAGGASFGILARIGDFLSGISLGKRIVASVVCVLALAIVFLYPLAQDYYKSFRDEQRVQAQVDAVADRNSAIEKENSDLETDEGVENQARKELGWVKDGDQSAVVTNAGEGSSTDSKLPSRVDTDSIEAPHTWYYDILDTVFFVDTRSDS